MKRSIRSRLIPALHRLTSHQYVPLGLLALAMVALLLVTLGPLTWLVAGDTVRQLSGKDRAAALNDVRQTVLTAIGGGAAMVAIGFTARTYYMSRRGQVTDRFGKAVSQLASSQLEERLGGLHALEQVMIESPRDHAAVLAVLCAYVRRRTLLPPEERHDPGKAVDFGSLDDHDEPEFDIDSAMTVLARRPDRPEPNRPDLRHVRLVHLSVRRYDFAHPPRLTRMFLTGSDLRRADLRGADLRSTIANYSDLQGAWLEDADLRGTSLHGVNMRRAILADARLTGAKLEGADLRSAEGLTASQLSAAAIDETTLLPRDLAEDPWVISRLADCAIPEDQKTAWFCPPPTPRPES